MNTLQFHAKTEQQQKAINKAIQTVKNNGFDDKIKEFVIEEGTLAIKKLHSLRQEMESFFDKEMVLELDYDHEFATEKGVDTVQSTRLSNAEAEVNNVLSPVIKQLIGGYEKIVSVEKSLAFTPSDDFFIKTGEITASLKAIMKAVEIPSTVNDTDASSLQEEKKEEIVDLVELAILSTNETLTGVTFDEPEKIEPETVDMPVVDNASLQEDVKEETGTEL